VPYLPEFKGADPDWLKATIFDVSGKPYKPKTPPRPHQLEGIAFALYQRKCLLYYGMRLGKTLMSLQWAEQLRVAGLWRGRGLIICHAPIALDVWTSEAERHSRLQVRPVRNKLDELIDALESDADLIVVPWSGLQAMFSTIHPSRKGKRKAYPDYAGVRIAAEAFSLAIIDEIHSAKNHESLRFKLAKELVKHCQYRIGLTGTPFGRDPFDVWAQAFLIDEGKTLSYSYPFFEMAFGVRKTNFFSGQVEYAFDKKKQPLLERKLSGLALSYRLEECQTVPVLAGNVELHITGDQRTAYQECVDKLIKLDDDETVEIRSVFVRMRQISSGYLPFEDAFGQTQILHFNDNAKLEWLEEMLITVKAERAATVIMHEYTLTGELICKALTRAGIRHEWLHGATKDKPGVVKAFQAGKIDALVVQAATGSLAIDLHRADYLLMYESPVSPIVRAQAEARPLSAARGARPLLLDDVTCSGVERKILSYIRDGRDLMASIVHERRSLRGEDVRSRGKQRNRG